MQKKWVFPEKKLDNTSKLSYNPYINYEKHEF